MQGKTTQAETLMPKSTVPPAETGGHPGRKRTKNAHRIDKAPQRGSPGALINRREKEKPEADPAEKTTDPVSHPTNKVDNLARGCRIDGAKAEISYVVATGTNLINTNFSLYHLTSIGIFIVIPSICYK